MTQNKDSGHFLTCAEFEKYMEYPVHCSFEQLLRNKVAELKSEVVGESVSVVSEEARKNMEDVPPAPKKKSEMETANNKCVRMMRPDGYYVMLKPKIPYPRASFLTHAQQAHYYVLKQKVAHQMLLGNAASSGPEASELEELRLLVSSEQKDYMQYLRQCFDQLKEDYNYVDITAQRYVQQVLFNRECRVKGSPAYYTTLVEHTLAPPGEQVPLVSEKIVLNVGVTPRITVPIISNQPDKKTRAICDQANELLQRYPVNPKSNPFTKSVVSYDFNCPALATKHHCDVVLSASAVTALLYTVDGKFLKNEYIPILIKEYDVQAENGEFEPHTVLYVNKPYKHYNLSTQDKQHLFHQTGLKHVLQLKTSEHYKPSTHLPPHRHFRNKNKKSEPPRGSVRQVQSGDDDLFGASVESLETFGTELSVKPKARVEVEKVKPEVTSERKRPLFGSTSPAKKARASLLDMVNPDLVTTVGSEGRRDKRLKQTASTKQTVNSALDGILESQCKLLSNEQTMRKPKEQTVRHELENPNHYVQWRAPKTSSYAVWNLGQLRLLIRSNHHGDVRDVNTNKTKPLYLCPKMEYQPTLGGEVLTLEECVKTWINSYIRHKCHVLRARIHAFTSEILMLEGLEHQKLLPPGCPYQPETAQTTLHQILSHLVSLPAGPYLLKCTADSDQIQVLQQRPKNNKDVFNFRQYMQDASQKASEALPRWLPIDTELEMPYHRYFNRVIATFQPADGVKMAQFVKQNKKNKKKKKSETPVSAKSVT